MSTCIASSTSPRFSSTTASQQQRLWLELLIWVARRKQIRTNKRGCFPSAIPFPYPLSSLFLSLLHFRQVDTPTMGATEPPADVPETPRRPSKPHSRPPSSRTSLSAHRKSQSSSALSSIADGGHRTPAERARKSSVLPVVEEGGKSSGSSGGEKTSKPREATVEGAQDALRDVSGAE